MPESTLRKLFPTPDNIPNWADILRDEMPFPITQYVIPHDPAAIEYWVTQAVFQALTGLDLIEYQRELIAGATETERQEIFLLDLMEKDRIKRAGDKFSAEIAEARVQGELARNADTTVPIPFYVYYDYWQGRVRIGADITLQSVPNESGYLILTAPIARIGENTGIPLTLAERRWESELDQGNPPLAAEACAQLFNKAETLGLNREMLIQKLARASIYELFLRRVGKSRINQILSTFNQPTTDNLVELLDNADTLMPIVYRHLTKHEQVSVDTVYNYAARTGVTLPIEIQSQKAELRISISLNPVNMQYNPQTSKLDLDPASARRYSIEAKLNPVLTPDSRHEDMLKLRQLALQLLQTAGI